MSEHKTKKSVPGGDTFIVDVKFRQNSTWQGVIKWGAGPREANFRSALEMIKIMDQVLTENHPEDRAE